METIVLETNSNPPCIHLVSWLIQKGDVETAVCPMISVPILKRISGNNLSATYALTPLRISEAGV